MQSEAERFDASMAAVVKLTPERGAGGMSINIPKFIRKLQLPRTDHRIGISSLK